MMPELARMRLIAALACLAVLQFVLALSASLAAVLTVTYINDSESDSTIGYSAICSSTGCTATCGLSSAWGDGLCLALNAARVFADIAASLCFFVVLGVVRMAYYPRLDTAAVVLTRRAMLICGCVAVVASIIAFTCIAQAKLVLDGILAQISFKTTTGFGPALPLEIVTFLMAAGTTLGLYLHSSNELAAKGGAAAAVTPGTRGKSGRSTGTPVAVKMAHAVC
ncbi:hypothetical protein HK105_203878 [Polyrhizophydium stewartii]|uniref:Transmembrane protein n=1 Tax=Polyrhizophydium stewartii TaxID=2732419 RepID=A0ABR4NA89_9FUNG